MPKTATVKRVCVYCGSRLGKNPAYTDAASALGLAIGNRKMNLTYGGSSMGLMGTVADAVLQAGGKVTGVIPDMLFDHEHDHPGITELITVKNMHQRKEVMSSLSDAFIALPGGFGTFEELLEAITWSQLKIHNKPIGILNVEGYYGFLVALIEQATEAGFINTKHRDLYCIDTSPDRLLDQIESRYRVRQSD
ncbi:MAG: TIGR00730 family Rossman fold protein [Gammaproteobacteria bacterium]|nr:TIGR00730 family Rossman fold protein [Gammaproteobacteria bacterium]MCY4218351.1 TIGR00730 family Rossman fold protein [Gammaproteobacteria bacterium]